MLPQDGFTKPCIRHKPACTLQRWCYNGSPDFMGMEWPACVLALKFTSNFQVSATKVVPNIMMAKSPCLMQPMRTSP